MYRPPPLGSASALMSSLPSAGIVPLDVDVPAVGLTLLSTWVLPSTLYTTSVVHTKLGEDDEPPPAARAGAAGTSTRARAASAMVSTTTPARRAWSCGYAEMTARVSGFIAVAPQPQPVSGQYGAIGETVGAPRVARGILRKS